MNPDYKSKNERYEAKIAKLKKRIRDANFVIERRDKRIEKLETIIKALYYCSNIKECNRDNCELYPCLIYEKLKEFGIDVFDYDTESLQKEYRN